MATISQFHRVGMDEISIASGAQVVHAFLDVSAMDAGDEFRLRVYDGSGRVSWETVLRGVQDRVFAFPSSMLRTGRRMTIQKIAGSDRTILSSVAQHDETVSRPLADLRSDCAELSSVIEVMNDLIDWSDGQDPRVDVLMHRQKDIADRIVGSTISGRRPTNHVGELMALHDRARPGSWFGDTDADGRTLTQEQTDMLVRAELWRTALRDVVGATSDELREVAGDPRMFEFTVMSQVLMGREVRPSRQRGGIDSDPLVRLLAYRAWGDRDRRWFELRGVRAGDRVVLVTDTTCAVDWFPEPGVVELPLTRHAARDLFIPRGLAMTDARPGENVWVADHNGKWLFNVSDRLRVRPEWNVIGVDLAFGHGFRPGDRVDALDAGGLRHGYVVSEVTANTLKLNTEPDPVARGHRVHADLEQKMAFPLREPTFKPGPGEHPRIPVPPWAKKRNRR